ncbi:RNA-guided endonuclease IscB [Streptomyces sp. NPDC059690]|uniref:RNA-guided endonuclease IscB n=1 Tax=Streptomyces sp. NPDC059690 TaxID=3346907 RepID=UPI0036AE3942
MTTFPAGEQSHQAVLPQQPALESVRADTPGSRDETAHGHPATARGTGREHGRGETGGRRTETRRRHAEPAATAAEKAENGSGDAPSSDRPYAGGVGASRVFVLSKDGRPLMSCHPARARELLRRGRAVVARQVPFTVRLKDRALTDSEIEGVQLRIDPGAQGTGLVLTDEKNVPGAGGATVTVRRGLISVELRHRGDQIRRCMQQRAGYRRRRRSANCRCRAPRSNNRGRRAGWLPPSLRHRVGTALSQAARLCRYAPVTEIHLESGPFNTHAMGAGKGLYGTQYARGPLAGTTVRSYLHARWNGSCAYCGTTGVPLNIEHLRPRSRGGSNRISNLVLACVPCNRAKGSRPVEVFLADDPGRLERIVEQTRASLRGAAAMNATQHRLTAGLQALGKPVYTWPGALTKANRDVTGLGKTHTLDALSVGPFGHESGDAIVRVPESVLVVEATGRGSYARTTPDRFGFPRLRRARAKRHFGYVTGDLVRAVMPSGRWKGTWSGRISVRARGQHSLATPGGRIDVCHGNLRLLQRGDGYAYRTRPEPVPGSSWKTG